MTEPRKPIFGFLWPKPDPDAPVDGAYRQVRRVRVTPRGPVRLAALIIGSLAMTMTTASLVTAALASGFSVMAFVASAVSASALVLVLRGWVVGTYVTDAGVTVDTTWRQTAVPWSDVRVITTVEQPAPWLGLPVRVRSERCVLHLADGGTLPTHVYATSPDLWLRPEALDMARLRLERWLEKK